MLIGDDFRRSGFLVVSLVFERVCTLLFGAIINLRISACCFSFYKRNLASVSVLDLKEAKKLRVTSGSSQSTGRSWRQEKFSPVFVQKWLESTALPTLKRNGLICRCRTLQLPPQRIIRTRLPTFLMWGQQPLYFRVIAHCASVRWSECILWRITTFVL